MPSALTFSKTLFTSDRVKDLPYTRATASDEEDSTFEAIRTYHDSEGDVGPSSVPNTAVVYKVLAGLPALIKKAEGLVHAFKDAQNILRKVLPTADFEEEN